MIDYYSQVKENLTRSIESFKETNEQSIGEILTAIDLMVEHGLLDRQKMQNAKLMSRIAFNTRTGRFVEKVVSLPNHQPVPSKWEQ